MVIKKELDQDITELDTRQRIMEVATHLFAVKGFDGTTIRDITREANVNVASMNYHFKSKENLRQEVLNHIMEDFRSRISSITDAKSSSDYAVKLHEKMIQNSANCVNQFKLILEAEVHPCENDPYPVGYEQFSTYLNHELKKTVPESERLWFVNIVFSYIVHISVMSSTSIGKQSIEKFMSKKKASIPMYISQLVESLIRDLNTRY